MKDTPAHAQPQQGRKLETAPREPTREVSCRALGVVLDAAESRGITLGDLIGKTPVTEDRLRDVDGWISWDSFVDLLQRFADAVGGDEDELRAIGYEHFGTQTFDFMRRVASFLVRPRDLYWMGTSWFGPQLFTVVDQRFEDLADGELRETLTVRPGHRGCRPLFLIMEGAMRAAPGLLGRPDSHVKLDLDDEGLRAVYTIRPPPRATITSTVRALGRSMLGGRFVVEELCQQQEQLRIHLDRLCEANQIVDEQDRHLRSVERIGRELARHIELVPLTETIFGTLGPVVGDRGLALYVQPITADEPRLLGYRGDVDGPPSHVFAMEIGGATVGRLELWDAPATGAAPLPPILEHLVRWIAIALDNARAHEAVREYGAQLEARVKETATERDEAHGYLENERLERESLAERLRRADEQLRLVEGLGSLSNLGVDVANQLLGPLATIRDAVSAARHPVTGAPDPVAIDAALDQIERAMRSATGVARGLSFFRTTPPERCRTDVNHCVELAVADAQAFARRRGAHVDVSLSKDPCFALVDRERTEQVVLSLLRSAIDASPSRGRVTVTTETGPRGVRITVEDDGPGIRAADLERVFELFYTSGRGTGRNAVGLSAARSIVASDGGTLRAESDGVRGARFVVALPPERRAADPHPVER